MKVVWLGPWKSNHGPSSIRLSWAKEFQKNDMVLTPVVLGSKNRWLENGFSKAIDVPASFGKIRRNMAYVRLLWNNRKEDCIVLGEKTMHLTLVARLFGYTQVVVDIRTLPIAYTSVFMTVFKWTEFSIQVLFSSLATKTLFITEGVKKISCRINPLLQTKNSMLYPSLIKVDEFKQRVWDQSHAEVLRLVYVGSLDPGRGLSYMVDGVKVLNQTRKAELHIYGGGHGYQDLQNYVEQSASDKFVHLKGYVDSVKVKTILCEYDIGLLCLPNEVVWRTSSPIKIFEYWAAGIPVMAANVDEIESILTDITYGATVSYGDLTGFVEAVDRILVVDKRANNAEMRRQLAFELADLSNIKHVCEFIKMD
ncbi:glycosyltransferase [Schleiferiaceae bacterium]|nr:glycosyltransferase [Schleiferiaceae bacterium]